MRKCPKCGREIEGETHLTMLGARPQPGDFSVCFYCLEMFQFTSTLELIVCDDPPEDLLNLVQRLRRAKQRAKELMN